MRALVFKISFSALVLTGGLFLEVNPVHAACSLETNTFMSCTFSNGRKSLDVCASKDVVIYNFVGKSEEDSLDISVNIPELDYTPWPGIGRTIWERITLYNDGVRYEVYGGINREYPQDENNEMKTSTFGGVEVFQEDRLLATLECDDGSVEFSYGAEIVDAMQSHNLCWDHSSKDWIGCKASEN